MSRYIGHVSLKGWTAAMLAEQLPSVPTPEERIVILKADVLDFVAEGGFTDLVMVFELGTENGHPHMHYELCSAKSEATLRRLFAKHFKKGAEGQFLSLKKADPAKLDRHTLYLAKGPTSKHGEEPVVLWDTHGLVLPFALQLVEPLHPCVQAHVEGVARAVPQKCAGDCFRPS